MKKKKRRKKKFPGDLAPGDQAYIKGATGQRYPVEITTIPAGHALVWVKHPIKGGKVLVTIPLDNLYPI